MKHLAAFTLLLLVFFSAVASYSSQNDPFYGEKLNVNVENLLSRDVHRRIDGARELARLRASESYPYLIQGLEDPDATVRYLCAVALGELGDQRAVNPLIGKLNDASSRVKEGAVQALGMLNNERAITPLIRTFHQSVNNIEGERDLITWNANDSSHNQDNLNVASAIIPVLSQFSGNSQVVNLLLEVMERDTSRTHNIVLIQQAIFALAKAGDRRAVEPLGKILSNHDLDPYIRNTAEDALYQLGVNQERIDQYRMQSGDAIDQLMNEANSTYQPRYNYDDRY